MEPLLCLSTCCRFHRHCIKHSESANLHVRLIAEGKPKDLSSADYIKKFTMDGTHAEPAGYLATVQAPDGMIHLISSHLHYRFNLAGLREPMA